MSKDYLKKDGNIDFGIEWNAQKISIKKTENSSENEWEYEENDVLSEKKNDNAENVKKHIEENGLDSLYDIVIANSTTIQIDIDTEDSYEIYNKNYEILKKFLGEHTVTTSLSKSKKMHITIKTQKKHPVMYRIALQAILGSDLVREALNYRNVVNKVKNPILFIEPKKHGEKNVL